MTQDRPRPPSPISRHRRGKRGRLPSDPTARRAGGIASPRSANVIALLFLSLALLLLNTLPTAVAAPYRYAETITPQVAQRGTEAKVHLKGNRLDGITGILAYSPGLRFIRAEPVPDPKNASKTLDIKTDVILVLEISDTCAFGEHLFRIRLKETLSELQTLWVSRYPCVQEMDPGARDAGEAPFDDAQEVALGTTVWGNFPAYSNFDQDFYKVELASGAKLTAEMWGSCLSNPIDASLTLYGPDREKILTVDDTTLRERDPFFSYVAEQAGPHYVVAHPFNDDENGDWRYALHLSSGGKSTIAYPLGGPAGTTLKLELFGDPWPEVEAEIPIAR